MKQAGADVLVYFMKEYIHNFLQFDSQSFGIPEYQNAHNITIKLFKRLLTLPSKTAPAQKKSRESTVQCTEQSNNK